MWNIFKINWKKLYSCKRSLLSLSNNLIPINERLINEIDQTHFFLHQIIFFQSRLTVKDWQTDLVVPRYELVRRETGGHCHLFVVSFWIISLEWCTTGQQWYYLFRATCRKMHVNTLNRKLNTFKKSDMVQLGADACSMLVTLLRQTRCLIKSIKKCFRFWDSWKGSLWNQPVPFHYPIVICTSISPPFFLLID